jgi:hypothetical protein
MRPADRHTNERAHALLFTPALAQRLAEFTRHVRQDSSPTPVALTDAPADLTPSILTATEPGGYPPCHVEAADIGDLTASGVG